MADLIFLTQRIPYPPTKGDKIRSWHILKYLASRYRVHLGCFVDDPHDEQFLPVLQEVCASVYCETLDPKRARIRSLRAFVKSEPLTVAYFGSTRLRRWVQQTVRQNGIERAFVFCSAMAPYVGDLVSAVRVLDMVDVDSQKWSQYSAASGWVGRIIYRRESRHLLRLERQMASTFDCTLLVSPAEAALFRELAPESADRIMAMSNGVDYEFFSPARAYPTPFPSDVPKAVFTGAMDYRPNIEAVCWFAESVMPELRRLGQPLEFWIVGSNPAASVRRLASHSDVRVTDRVADVRPYLSHAHVVVAPLLTARGIQNKVLEAMAMAKPVVATRDAIEGISAVEGEEVFVADDPPAFARKIMAALSERGALVGRRARRRVESDYDWAQLLKAIDNLFEGGTPTQDLAARASAL